MASEKDIHAEDIVRLLKSKDGKAKLGLVLRSGRNISDSEESTESEEDEVKVKEDEVLVCWYPTGAEEVVSLKKVKLVDRSLQPGDIVRHATRPNQKGYVNDISISADVSILGSQKIIRNVDSKKYLSPLQPFMELTHVCLGPWVGYVKQEHRRVVLWLKNGSRCSIEEEQLAFFSDALEKRDESCPFYNLSFYPGQALVGPAHALQEAKWLTRIKPILTDQSKIKAVVQESKVVKLEVHWQVCGSLPGCNSEDYAKPPPTIITEDEIDKVKAFNRYCDQLQIGDKGFYVVRDGDVEDHTAPVTQEKQNESHSETNGINCCEDQEKCSNCDTASKDCAEACGVSCEPTDDEVSKQTSATGISLSQNKSLGPHDTSDNLSSDALGKQSTTSTIKDCENSQLRYTSVASNDHSTCGADEAAVFDHEASVEDDADEARALDMDSEDGDVESDGPDKPKQATSKKYVSYSSSTRRRRKRPRHKRKQQSTVRVKPGDRVCVEVINTKTTADVLWQDGRLETNVDTLDLVSIYHIDEHQFLPGYFVNDKRGEGNLGKYGVIRSSSDVDRTCVVKWFSTTGEELGIEEDVSVYDLRENEDMVFNPGDLVVAMNSACVVEGGPRGVAGQVASVDPDGYVAVDWLGNSYPVRGRHRPQELYRVESEGDEDAGSEESSENASGENSENDEWDTASEEGNPGDDNELAEIIDSLVEESLSAISPPANEDPETPASPLVLNVDVEALNNANHLENEVERSSESDAEAFLMLGEVHESHHYYQDHATFAPCNQRMFMSVLRKEILLLRSSLPSGILIRGFEDACELFTVLIIGPEDTPYEDGVFVFDIKLPPNYPAIPPSVFFVSMTTTPLNPNLYVDGNVCTSLLGTWPGKDSESWTEKSNMLQVLLSIQALILCKEPYYNEAGYEKHRGSVEGIENSRVYNEMAILHLVSAMAAAIKSKHPVFNGEIRNHFLKNGQRTIDRYKSWIQNSRKTCVEESKTLQQSSCEVSAETASEETEQFRAPEFPLCPLSKGFCICLERNIEMFSKVLTDEKLVEKLFK